MKTKTLIIIGGIVALLLILQNNKNVVEDFINPSDDESNDETATSDGNDVGGSMGGGSMGGGSMGGGSMSSGSMGGVVIPPTNVIILPTLETNELNLMPKPTLNVMPKPTLNVMPKPTAGTSQVTVMPKPLPVSSTKSNDLDVPSGMDLPTLTGGTGVSTETSIQLGGVITAPKPAIVSPPTASIDESLIHSGVRPIVKPVSKNLSSLEN